MLTIWTRREFTVTYDMKQQSEIRDLLSQHGIDYSVRVINRKSPSPFAAGSRARTGTFGENLQMAYEYIIYVRKSDYDMAVAVIHGRIR